MHQRTVCVAMVPDSGERIVTKNRYAPAMVKIDSLGNSITVVNENECERLKALFPEVFDRNGILFVERDYSMSPQDRSYGWTVAFPYGASLLTLPMCSTVEHREGLTIEVLESPDANSRIDTYIRMDTAFAMWTPSPFLCYIGEVGLGEFKGFKKFSAHDYNILFDMKLNGSGKSTELWTGGTAKAYAIAAALKRMEDEGRVRDPVTNNQRRRGMETGRSVSDRFEISDFRRDGEKDWRYLFVLKLRDANLSVGELREIQDAVREVIRGDYVDSFPSARKGTLVIDFPEYEIDNGIVEGTAVALSLQVKSLEYNPETRRGVMQIHFNPGQLADARRCIRKHIETLARDKNVALVSGTLPQSARFYLLNETMTDEILTVEFKTE